MSASVVISINDGVYADATEAQNQLRPGSDVSGAERLLRLADYLRKRAGAGTLAGKIAVSGTSLVRASGTLTTTGNFTANDTFSIGPITLTAVASGATANQFNIGASASASLDAAIAVINAHATLGKLFVASKPTAATMLVTSKIPGLVGNGIRFLEGTDGGGTFSLNGSGVLGATTAGAGGDDASSVDFVGISGGTVF